MPDSTALTFRLRTTPAFQVQSSARRRARYFPLRDSRAQSPRIKTSNTQTTSRTAAATRYRSIRRSFWLGSVILLISVPRCTAPDYRAAMTATTNIMPKITFQKMPASAGHRRPHQGHLHADVETSCPQSSHFANAMRTLWHEASGIVDLLRSPRRWPMTIGQRVAKLEKQNRWMRLARVGGSLRRRLPDDVALGVLELEKHAAVPPDAEPEAVDAVLVTNPKERRAPRR